MMIVLFRKLKDLDTYQSSLVITVDGQEISLASQLVEEVELRYKDTPINMERGFVIDFLFKNQPQCRDFSFRKIVFNVQDDWKLAQTHWQSKSRREVVELQQLVLRELLDEHISPLIHKHVFTNESKK